MNGATQDEKAGINWWNALPEQARAGWLKRACSAIPAEAWRAFKLQQPKYSYVVNPQPVELGGGWRLSLLEQGQEVGGGVFPPVVGIEDAAAATKAAHLEAVDVGEDWIASRA